MADSIPRSFGTDEDVNGWTDTGIIDEDTQSDMSEFAIAGRKPITLAEFAKKHADQFRY